MKAPSVQKWKKVIFTHIDPQRYVWRVAQNGQSDLPWVSSEPVRISSNWFQFKTWRSQMMAYIYQHKNDSVASKLSLVAKQTVAI